MDIDYEVQKEEFVDRLTNFIRTQTKFSTEEVIEKLHQFITEYTKFFNDNKNDNDMIISLQKDLEWYNNIIKSQNILKKEIEVKEQEQIRKDVVELQFKYKTSLWRKLFSQRSFHNEVYGQALLHVTLGVLLDMKVPVGERFIWGRPSLFFMQRSRSGKNEGMNFVVAVLFPR